VESTTANQAKFNVSMKIKALNCYPSVRSEFRTPTIFVNLLVNGKLTQLNTSGAPGPAFESVHGKANTKQQITYRAEQSTSAF